MTASLLARHLIATVPVNLRVTVAPGIPGGVQRHEIEVIEYHIAGWATTRCLNHGREAVDIYSGDPKQTAIWAARECRRVRRLPAAPADRPLTPIWVLRANAIAAELLDAAAGSPGDAEQLARTTRYLNEGAQ